jgi:hypothetical protein
LQLLTLAFPGKMAATLVVFAVLAPVFPKIFAAEAGRMLTVLWKSMGF